MTRYGLARSNVIQDEHELARVVCIWNNRDDLIHEQKVHDAIKRNIPTSNEFIVTQRLHSSDMMQAIVNIDEDESNKEFDKVFTLK